MGVDGRLACHAAYHASPCGTMWVPAKQVICAPLGAAIRRAPVEHSRDGKRPSIWNFDGWAEDLHDPLPPGKGPTRSSKVLLQLAAEFPRTSIAIPQVDMARSSMAQCNPG